MGLHVYWTEDTLGLSGRGFRGATKRKKTKEAPDPREAK